MAMMTSPYDVQVISLSGHSPIFKRDESTFVPDVPFLIKECLGRGIVMSDNQDAPKVVAPVEIVDNLEDAEEEFVVGLDRALIRILTRNDPNDLKKDLYPKANKVTAEMSPDLRRPTSTEISEAYERLQENIDLAE